MKPSTIIVLAVPLGLGIGGCSVVPSDQLVAFVPTAATDLDAGRDRIDFRIPGRVDALPVVRNQVLAKARGRGWHAPTDATFFSDKGGNVWCTVLNEGTGPSDEDLSDQYAIICDSDQSDLPRG